MHKLFTVLLVDDEPSIRNGINNILQKEFRYNLITLLASNGEEAFSLFRKHSPDLIISDIVMPKATGLQLMEAVRETGSDVPVVLLSGYDDFAYAQKAIRLKVKNYLTKPLNRADLIAEVKSCMTENARKRTMTEDDYNSYIRSARILFLQRLLQGEIKSDEEINRTYENLGFTFRKDRMTVVIGNVPKEDKELLLRTIKETFRDRNTLMHIELSGRQVFISDTEEQHTRHNLKILLDTLKDRPIRFYQGRSIGPDMKKLCLSYRSALLAASYAIYYPDKRYIDQSVIINTTPRLSSSDINTEKLKDYLMIGTDDQITKWMECFFNKLFYIPTPPPSYLKGMCIFLINDIERLLITGANVKKEFFPPFDTTSFNQIGSIGEIKTFLIGFMLDIRHKTVPKSLIDNDTIIYRAKTYIDKHLMENISLKDIAAYTNMAPTYFSSYFKTKTGETFRDYLSRKKNSYAKTLLSDPGLSIEEIAQKLGYSNYRSFHRIFKNLNDITPTEFRKQMKEIR